jgi:ABC-type nickel/cobalt efflux system permease component RcnA
MKRVGRSAVVAMAAAVIVLSGASAASAHPLGNFTSNTYAGIRVAQDRLEASYVLDLAEIPTQQTFPSIDRDGDGAVSDPEASAYVTTECAALASGLDVQAARHHVRVMAGGGRLAFPPGLAGLSILRLECDLYTAPGSVAIGDAVTVRDANLVDRIGWHEMTASAGSGGSVRAADVPSTSVSNELRAYPAGTPSLDVRVANFVVSSGDASANGVRDATQGTAEQAVPGGDRATELFASLVDHPLTVGFALLALLASLVLGAFHALAPGHGKTVMAAYIVGRRGSARHALGIGLTVATTHTAGVLVLGLVLWSSEALAPERVYPLLGTASGVLVAAVGVGLLLRVVRAARRGESAFGHTHGAGPGQHTHAWIDELEVQLAGDRVLVGAGAPLAPHAQHGDDGHDHPHGHENDDHGHRHGDHDYHHEPVRASGSFGWGGILAMGFAGGMVPSPSAVVVLLGALTLGRAWFGVTLVIGYGLGMALTLLAAGLVLARAQRWLEPRLAQRRRLVRIAGLLPIVTAVAVLGGGLFLAFRALAAA